MAMESVFCFFDILRRRFENRFLGNLIDVDDLFIDIDPIEGTVSAVDKG